MIKGRSSRSIAALVMALLALQALPLIASSQAGQRAPGGSVSSPRLSPSLNPDYLILGQLEGTTVRQSQRPHSATLPGYQYAATYYGAKDLQSAYGATTLFSQGYDGRGETIAVVDAYGDPTIRQDMATFDKAFGLPPVNLTVIPVGPYEPSLGMVYGWDAETALDVEAAHAMAPYAHINLVVASNNSNALFEAVKVVVTQKLGDVVTMSWGSGENSFGESGWSAAGFLNYPYVEYYFQLGAAEGITFFSSSGDYGAFQGTTTVTAGWPADSPLVTGVGGTTLFLTPQIGLYSLFNSTATYEGEEAWSVSPQYVGPQGISSGGGYSVIWPQPYYQAGATDSKARASPDVSADANPYTGMVIVLEGGYYVIGGTSLSSPLWAGMAADLNQYVGRDLGPLNPYLYSIYGNKSAYANDFHQVTYGFNGEYQAGPGYNLVTGMGSPDLPNLAADVKSQAQGLKVSVTTAPGTSPTAPAQYTYGEKINISAAITNPQGSSVLSGTFTAKIEGPGGVIATVPLSLAGTSWTGRHVIASGDPQGQWTITVSGSGGGASGAGLAEVNVGNSIGIESPLPYPFGAAVTPGVPFIVQVAASDPSGGPISTANITADLIYGGSVVNSLLLTPLGGGVYWASATLTTAEPQGTYSLVVHGPSFATAFAYLYVGEEVTGIMITPNDEAIPSVYPGQQVTFLAKAQTAAGVGVYTSNITAKVYSLSGGVMSSTVLAPAPNKVQFGVFNFFGYQQANFTIPDNLTNGFYKLQFQTSLKGYNSTSGPILGNYTTGFYVGGPELTYTISTPATVYEGQYITAVARITDSSGAPVTSGVFLATFVPSGYAFESYITDALGYTSVPMFYDQSAHGWYAEYQVPSVLTSPNAFVGNLLSLSSGPWTVFVAGESPGASNAFPADAYVSVLPYTFYTKALLDRSNVDSAPLVTKNGTGYSLGAIGADTLEVRGLDITLSGVSIANLNIVDSTVRLDGSQVGTLTVSNSTLTLGPGTQVAQLSPPLPTISVTGLSHPLTGDTPFTIIVTGEQLTERSLNASIDGAPIAVASTLNPTGLSATGTVKTGSLSSGVHVLSLTATQSDGLSSTVTTYFSVNSEGAALANLTYLVYGLGVLAILGLVVALTALRRRPTASAGADASPHV